MPIFEADIKLLKSARMSDTPDGGGRMTGTVVQSGVDNNVFDDVSGLDRVHGSASLRKLFGAVLTNTTDKYLGARVLVDEGPQDNNVHVLLFAASSLFDTRQQAQNRVEAYLTTGSPYQGLLYGPHIVGMRVVTLIQQQDRAVPSIGQVFVLGKDMGLPSEVTQFVRVTAVVHSVLNFTDATGNFARRVVVCDTSDALRHDFAGWEALRQDADLNYTGKARVFATVVADAAQYYGIRPLAQAASMGDFAVKADSSYSQLLPSAQIETPIADASATGYALAAQAVGNDVTYTVNATLSTTQKLFIGAAVARGSLRMVAPGWPGPGTDTGAGVLTISGAAAGAVDYDNGVVTLLDAARNVSGGLTITYRLAATPLLALRSTGILITPENRSLSYVKTLNSLPAKGTLTLSYMVADQWYVLRDNGAGALIADDAGFGAGNVNTVTGTVTVTLGALPDVGGTLVIQWGEASAATEIAASDLGAVPRLFFEYVHPLGAAVLPHTDVALQWSYGNNNYSATLTNGVSAGHATIEPVQVDGAGLAGPWQGRFRVYPHRVPPAGTVVTVAARASTAQTQAAVAARGFAFAQAVAKRSARIVDLVVGFEFVVNGQVNDADVLVSQRWADGTHPMPLTWSLLPKSLNYTQTLTAFDDGAGNMRVTYYFSGHWTQLVVGTIDYATGAVVLSASTALPADAAGPDVDLRAAGGYWHNVKWRELDAARRNGVVTIAAQTRNAEYTPQGGSVSNTTTTPTQYLLKPNVPPLPGTVLKGLVFAVGGKVYAQGNTVPQAGQLVTGIDPATGLNTVVGTVDANTGFAALNVWPSDGPDSLVTGFGASRLPVSAVAAEYNRFLSAEVVFRTPTAPLRPGGFSVLGTLTDGTAFNLTADALGKIDTPHVAGVVNYQTGVCRLWAKESRPGYQVPGAGYEVTGYYAQVLGYTSFYQSMQGFRLATVRYNAVAYTYLPMDANILGLDPVRLPSDGRVPVFKAGRVVVVHNTVKRTPQAVANGQTVNTGRTRLARLRVWGNDGLEITSGFAKNLDLGTVTFTNIAGMSQPVTIEHRIEDEALCAEAQITGDLRLTRPLTHDYPVAGTFVSSAMVVGTLQAAAADAFAQAAWTDEWADVRIGPPLLAAYNQTANPILVTNAGAITERWALIFYSNTAFKVVGEASGQIMTGDTGSTLSPVNAATGVPLFTVNPAGWGGGWVAGNVLRFNTRGANFPMWLARTVLQSPSAPPGTDQATLSIRGDIDE